jgi:broad specificity phosphatase PhoE
MQAGHQLSVIAANGMDLILVRHGQSQFNVDQSGGVDSPLTDLGKRQAHRLGLFLAREQAIDVIYSSSMARAKETAQIIATYVGKSIEYVDDLREAEEEYWSGFDRYANPVDSLDASPVSPAGINAAYAEFQGRVVRAFQKILTAHSEGTVLVVSHGGVMGTVVRTLAGAHQLSIHSDNTCVTQFHFEAGRWHLVCLNRIHHLLNDDDLVQARPTFEHIRE